ncbi:MAG: AmmeMemoRadiSam system protein B [Proteobacteria bacterium]|nr:AmmeMemoRadiSam system protein B [Pseudomonadota bacterium]
MSRNRRIPSSPGPGRPVRLQIAILILFLALPLASARATEVGLRPSALAGQWYPAQAGELKSQVRAFLDRAAVPKVQGRLKALVVPHAGHRYSGPVAAFAYNLLKNRTFETVVLIGPSHRAAFPGASLNYQDYETPLGRVSLDRDLADRIQKAAGPLVTGRPEIHQSEHCLEIQLPFIQTVLPQARIVPLLVGNRRYGSSVALGRALAEAMRGRNALLLASTDLSHEHPAPEARLLDARVIERVRGLDGRGLHLDMLNGRSEACGEGPLIAVMEAARSLGANRAEILKYDHSGTVTGDNDHVVGYVAAALVEGNGADPKSKGNKADPAPPRLGPAEKAQLLGLARRALDCAFDGRDFTFPKGLSPALNSLGGAFVTIKMKDGLRGCIGHLAANHPVSEVVPYMAVSAAFRDPRFSPLTRSEYREGVSLEISVLTPFELVDRVEDIQVGRDGLMIAQGERQGLLLPQVAVENGWDREKFLDQTCVKAGLPAGTWRQANVDLYRFSAQVFGEDEKAGAGK